MKIKYRLIGKRMFRFAYQEFIDTVYEFDRIEWHIQKKTIFGWKTIMDNINDKDYGLKLLDKLKGMQGA